MTSGSRRPHVICHMMASVDGRIVTGGWPLGSEGRRQYELVHASYEADGWICGRVTMEPFAKRVRSEADVAREHAGGAPREDFRAPGMYDAFAFAIDPSGRLAWESNDIDGDHVVAILSERVSDEYLAFLRQRASRSITASGQSGPTAGRPQGAPAGAPGGFDAPVTSPTTGSGSSSGCSTRRASSASTARR